MKHKFKPKLWDFRFTTSPALGMKYYKEGGMKAKFSPSYNEDYERSQVAKEVCRACEGKKPMFLPSHPCTVDHKPCNLTTPQSSCGKYHPHGFFSESSTLYCYNSLIE